MSATSRRSPLPGAAQSVTRYLYLLFTLSMDSGAGPSTREPGVPAEAESSSARTLEAHLSTWASSSPAMVTASSSGNGGLCCSRLSSISEAKKLS